MNEAETSDKTMARLQAELDRYRRREALYDATEKAAHIGHYEWNYDEDRLEACSAEYARIYAMSVDEIMRAQSSWDGSLAQVHEDDRAGYREAAGILRNRGQLETQYRIVLRDGSVRHVQETGVVIADDEGEVSGSFGLLQDITEQVKHERDLEYRDELSRQAESITDIGHFIYDEHNERYVYLSEGFARIYGTTVEAYMKKMTSVSEDLSDILEEDRDRVMEAYRRYVETGEDCAIEYRILRPDGQVRWLRELGTAKFRQRGRVTQTLGVVQDITQRVAREQELVLKDVLANQAEALTDLGHFLFDEREDRHLFVSPGQARIVGMEPGEFEKCIVTNEDYIALVVEEDRESVRKAYTEELNREGRWEVEYRLLRPDGETRWIREMGTVIKQDEAGVVQTLGVIQDITAQKIAEQELVYKDALATQAESITDIGHFVYDEIRQTYLYASPGMACIHGVESTELLERSISWEADLERVHADDRADVKKAYDDFLARGGDWQVEYRLLRADGQVRWVREIGKAHRVSHGIPEQTIGVLQDITAQKNAEQEIVEARDTLEQQVVERTRELATTVKQLQEEIAEREKIAAELDFLANHDALTGLPSLRLGKDRLDQSLAKARRNRQTSAVMFLDLDGFKQVNDAHGHEVGDLVLKVVADRIKDEIRETDTVARIGGDEFVVILSSLPSEAIAERIAKNLIDQISQTIHIETFEIGVTVSIGISFYPQNGTTAEQLIRSADKAMYRIKHDGKNAFGYATGSQLYEINGERRRAQERKIR